jgi:hypothetical protein
MNCEANPPSSHVGFTALSLHLPRFVQRAPVKASGSCEWETKARRTKFVLLLLLRNVGRQELLFTLQRTQPPCKRIIDLTSSAVNSYPLFPKEMCLERLRLVTTRFGWRFKGKQKCLAPCVGESGLMRLLRIAVAA